MKSKWEDTTARSTRAFVHGVTVIVLHVDWIPDKQRWDIELSIAGRKFNNDSTWRTRLGAKRAVTAWLKEWILYERRNLDALEGMI